MILISPYTVCVWAHKSQQTVWGRPPPFAHKQCTVDKRPGGLITVIMYVSPVTYYSIAETSPYVSINPASAAATDAVKSCVESPPSPWSHPPLKVTPLLTLGGQDLSASDSVSSSTSLDVIEKVEVGPTVKDENQAYDTLQLSNTSSSICSRYSGSSGSSLESSSSSTDMLVEIVPAHAAPIAAAAADSNGSSGGNRGRGFAPPRLSDFFMRFVRNHPQLVHVLGVQLKVSSKAMGLERAEDALLREGGAWCSWSPAAVGSALLVGSRHNKPPDPLCIISLQRATAHLLWLTIEFGNQLPITALGRCLPCLSLSAFLTI